MDPNFNKEEFLKQCEHDIIPNILEAMVEGDLEILKDWCHEAPYSVLSTPIKQALALGHSLSYYLNKKLIHLLELLRYSVG